MESATFVNTKPKSCEQLLFYLDCWNQLWPTDQKIIFVTSQNSTRLWWLRQQVSNPVFSIIHGKKQAPSRMSFLCVRFANKKWRRNQVGANHTLMTITWVLMILPKPTAFSIRELWHISLLVLCQTILWFFPSLALRCNIPLTSARWLSSLKRYIYTMTYKRTKVGLPAKTKNKQTNKKTTILRCLKSLEC